MTGWRENTAHTRAAILSRCTWGMNCKYIKDSSDSQTHLNVFIFFLSPAAFISHTSVMPLAASIPVLTSALLFFPAGLVDPAVFVEPLTEERAARTLYRIELLRKIREQVGKSSSLILVQTQSYLQRSPPTPQNVSVDLSSCQDTNGPYSSLLTFYVSHL